MRYRTAHRRLGVVPSWIRYLVLLAADHYEPNALGSTDSVVVVK
jgi:hypothetical protein